MRNRSSSRRLAWFKRGLKRGPKLSREKLAEYVLQKWPGVLPQHSRKAENDHDRV